MPTKIFANPRRPIPSLPLGLAALVLSLAFPVASSAASEDENAAGDWPQFRGPDRVGVAPDAPRLDAWPADGPRELWRRSIGGGFSGVAAVGDRLYTLEIASNGEEAFLALDAKTGETLWRRALGETPVVTEFGDGPRATPTVSRGVIFGTTSQATLFALAADDGRVLWRRELGRPAPRFGYASSPLVVDDLVIVEAGSETAGESVVALDRATGEVRWSALDGPAGYSSPVRATLAGVPQILLFRRTPEVVALSLDGEVLWRHETPGAVAAIAAPRARRGPPGVVLWRHETPGAVAAIAAPLPLVGDRVFVASSDDAFGGLMLRVHRDEAGAFSTVEAWSERLMRNHFNASVVVDGHLYGFDNSTFKCLDAETGERRWAKRGFGKGSLVAAGDRLLVLGDDGVLALVAADPAAYRELGRVRATTGKAWTEPTLANGRVIVRDHDEIVAFDVRAAASDAGPAGDGDGSSAAVAPSGSSPSASASTEGDAAPAELRRILERHAVARGGLERWAAVDALEASGTYAAFSETAPFTLVRARGEGFFDLYRLDFTLLGAPASRARDREGAWHRHKLLQPEPGRVEEGPYRDLLERESLFGPVLLRALGEERPEGFEVTLLGSGDIAGRATIDLRIRFPDGDEERWSLDADTYLEVAVEGEVQDFTQMPGPMGSRIFFSDFREVDGLVLPHRLDWEYGARLETMQVEHWRVDPEIEPDRFEPPRGDGDGSPSSTDP